MKKTVHDLLREASELISERGQSYGGLEQNFQLIADLATLRLGRNFHAYEIAVILCCVKNARSFASPDHEDSHLDACNYEIFAATFAEDYVQSKPTDNIDYKRRADLKAAVVSKPNATTSVGIRPHEAAAKKLEAVE